MRYLTIFLFMCLLSFNAFADTIYLQIPILANNLIFTPEAFAVDYLDTTGEIYVLGNMNEQAGVKQMSGSSRITEAQAAELKSRWPMMQYYVSINGELPPNWTPKVYPDE